MNNATQEFATEATKTWPCLRAGAVLLCLTLIPAGSSARADGGGHVLPANASPHGVSLAQESQAVIPFTLSGNDPSYYPNTPFQVLYATNNQNFQIVGTTLVETGGNTFTVPSGTSFYVPIQGVDNTPPVPGTFPTTVAQARSYIFDPSQYGGVFEIIVDGKTTPIGPSYVALTTPFPLSDALVAHLASLGTVVPNGFPYQSATVGAFLTPLSVGTHTVTIKTTLGGAFLAAYGVTALDAEFTYTVNVVPH